MAQVPHIVYETGDVNTFSAIETADFVLRAFPMWSNWRYQNSVEQCYPILTYYDGDYQVEEMNTQPQWKWYEDAKESCGSDLGLAFVLRDGDWQEYESELLWLQQLPGVRLFHESTRNEAPARDVHAIPDLMTYIVENMSPTPHDFRLALERFTPRMEQLMHDDALPSLWQSIYGDQGDRLYGVVLEEYVSRQRFSVRNLRELRDKIRCYGYSKLEDVERMYESAHSYQHSPPERPRPQHPDLLMESGVTVLAGRPKQGKSFMALDLALSVSYPEHRFLGVYPMQIPGDVLYYALEDHAPRIYQRLLGLLPIEPMPSNLYFGYDAPRIAEGFLDLLANWMRAKPETKLIVIDILKHVQSRRDRNENLYDFEYDDMKRLIEFAHRHQLHLLMLTHLRKLQSRDVVSSDDVMSSTAITGGASNVWLLKRRSEEDLDATLSISGKDVPSWEMALKWRMGLTQPYWEAIGDNDQRVLGASMRAQVLRALYRWEGAAPNQNQLLQSINPSYSRGAFHRLIAELLENGLVRKDAGKLTLTESGSNEADRDF